MDTSTHYILLRISVFSEMTVFFFVAKVLFQFLTKCKYKKQDNVSGKHFQVKDAIKMNVLVKNLFFIK